MRAEIAEHTAAQEQMQASIDQWSGQTADNTQTLGQVKELSEQSLQGVREAVKHLEAGASPVATSTPYGKEDVLKDLSADDDGGQRIHAAMAGSAMAEVSQELEGGLGEVEVFQAAEAVQEKDHPAVGPSSTRASSADKSHMGNRILNPSVGDILGTIFDLQRLLQLIDEMGKSADEDLLCQWAQKERARWRAEESWLRRDVDLLQQRAGDGFQENHQLKARLGETREQLSQTFAVAKRLMEDIWAMGEDWTCIQAEEGQYTERPPEPTLPPEEICVECLPILLPGGNVRHMLGCHRRIMARPQRSNQGAGASNLDE